MILLTDSKPDDQQSDVDTLIVPTDQPPAYEAGSSATSYPPRPQEKSPALRSYSPSPSPSSPNASTSTQPAPNASQSSTRSPASWFSFGALSRTDREVKNTILGLVRDVVKQTSSPATVSILQSCAEAARARGLQFDAILQEKSIEGHTPLYWAIVKRDIKGPPSEYEVGVLDLLLSFPLKDATRSDACAACIIQSDNGLFQYLQHTPGWRPKVQRGMEEMLFGAVPQDSVTVYHDNKAADTGAFKADFHVPSFQKRLRVSKSVRMEFVARERMWALTFRRDPLSSESGPRRAAGDVNLHLMEHSPRTPFRGRITVNEAKRPMETSGSTARPVVITLKTTSDLEPQSSLYDSGVRAALDEVAGGAALQYDGSSFISEDGSLDFTLEGVLTLSGEPDCIIM